MLELLLRLLLLLGFLEREPTDVAAGVGVVLVRCKESTCVLDLLFQHVRKPGGSRRRSCNCSGMSNWLQGNVLDGADFRGFAADTVVIVVMLH